MVWVASLGWGSLLSRRPIVAVSATRLKVVAIERFAHQRRSTLTRSATTAGWRLSGKGGEWSRSMPFRASPEKRNPLGLAADPCHSTGALTGRVSRLVNV